MSQHYSRRQKSSTEDKEPTPAKHIKKVFSLSKTVALIGSILSIIVASITITNALKGHQQLSQLTNQRQLSSSRWQ